MLAIKGMQKEPSPLLFVFAMKNDCGHWPWAAFAPKDGSLAKENTSLKDLPGMRLWFWNLMWLKPSRACSAVNCWSRNLAGENTAPHRHLPFSGRILAPDMWSEGNMTNPKIQAERTKCLQGCSPPSGILEGSGQLAQEAFQWGIMKRKDGYTLWWWDFSHLP